MGQTSRRQRALVLALACLILAASSSAAGTQTNNMRVSVSTEGVQGNGDSNLGALSLNGQFAVFASDATNLVPRDSNGHRDIFVRDVSAGTTLLASVTSSGAQLDESTQEVPDISADGRHVAFDAQATNLVPGDMDRDLDVFVRDIVSGTTSLASVAPDGRPGSVWHARSGTWLSATSNWPALSGDGRFVAFLSDATNLLSSDPANQLYAGQQVYLRDLATSQNVLISMSSSGEPANCQCGGNAFAPPVVSYDGRFVAFLSNAVNLVPGDTNGRSDVFVRDRLAGTTERVSVSSSGAQLDQAGILEQPAMSPDGRFVAFSANATNLVEGDTNGFSDVFVRDRATGRTERVSLGNAGREGTNGSGRPSISADGRFVSFMSAANNLVDNDSWPICCDVFVRDRLSGTTVRVTIPTGGGTPARGEGSSGARAMSADGRRVGLSTAAPLGPGDTNGADDAYVHDRMIAATPTPAKGGAAATLSIVTRGRRVIARGAVAMCCGTRITGNVLVVLYRKRGGKMARVASRRAPLAEAGKYSASFRRPKAGRCRATAHYLGNEFYAGGLTTKNFRC